MCHNKQEKAEPDAASGRIRFRLEKRIYKKKSRIEFKAHTRTSRQNRTPGVHREEVAEINCIIM